MEDKAPKKQIIVSRKINFVPPPDWNDYISALSRVNELTGREAHLRKMISFCPHRKENLEAELTRVIQDKEHARLFIYDYMKRNSQYFNHEAAWCRAPQE